MSYLCALDGTAFPTFLHSFRFLSRKNCLCAFGRVRCQGAATSPARSVCFGDGVAPPLPWLSAGGTGRRCQFLPWISEGLAAFGIHFGYRHRMVVAFARFRLFLLGILLAARRPRVRVLQEVWISGQEVAKKWPISNLFFLLLSI